MILSEQLLHFTLESILPNTTISECNHYLISSGIFSEWKIYAHTVRIWEKCVSFRSCKTEMVSRVVYSAQYFFVGYLIHSAKNVDEADNLGPCVSFRKAVTFRTWDYPPSYDHFWMSLSPDSFGCLFLSEIFTHKHGWNPGKGGIFSPPLPPLVENSTKKKIANTSHSKAKHQKKGRFCRFLRPASWELSCHQVTIGRAHNSLWAYNSLPLFLVYI